jgi:hypothetical protein
MIRSRVRALAFLAAACVPDRAAAQGDTYARVSLSTAQLYDGNLFAVAAAAGAPEADLISRIGPLFEAGFESIPIKLRTAYEVDAERYLNHPDLNRMAARQRAAASIEYAPTPRLAVKADGSFASTQTPNELNVESQLAVRRASADRLGVDASGVYELNAVTKTLVGYSGAHEALDGGIAGGSQRSRIGIERRTGARDAVRLEYDLRHFEFSSGGTEMSHTIAAGWAHAFTSRTGFEIAGGPRIARGGIQPELSATVKHRAWHSELTAGYDRTEIMAVGEPGALEMHRANASALYRPLRKLTVIVAPAASRVDRGGDRVVVYSADAVATLQAAPGLSLAVSGRIGHQIGTLVDPRAAIPSRGFGVQLIVTAPRRERPALGGFPL